MCNPPTGCQSLINLCCYVVCYTWVDSVEDCKTSIYFFISQESQVRQRKQNGCNSMHSPSMELRNLRLLQMFFSDGGGEFWDWERLTGDAEIVPCARLEQRCGCRTAAASVTVRVRKHCCRRRCSGRTLPSCICTASTNRPTKRNERASIIAIAKEIGLHCVPCRSFTLSQRTLQSASAFYH